MSAGASVRPIEGPPTPVTRRAFIGGAGALAASARLDASPTLIAEAAVARVIVDNDFAGDPDGLVALAHQLLAPKAKCTLVTTTALDGTLARLGRQRPGATAAAGRDAALELIARMNLASPPQVVAGAETFGVGSEAVSDAARAIVREAMRPDPLPLFLACGGPLTNVAAALRLQPSIARRLTLVWIGGAGYPEGGRENNLSTDPAAARLVVEGSTVSLWQVPEPAYRQLQASMAELAADVWPISPVSAWLRERYAHLPPFVKLSGAIGFGDSALPLLTAVSAESSAYREQAARRIGDDQRYDAALGGRLIRVYDRLDARLTLTDFIARLRLQAAGGRHAGPSPANGCFADWKRGQA